MKQKTSALDNFLPIRYLEVSSGLECVIGTAREFYQTFEEVAFDEAAYLFFNYDGGQITLQAQIWDDKVKSAEVLGTVWKSRSLLPEDLNQVQFIDMSKNDFFTIDQIVLFIGLRTGCFEITEDEPGFKQLIADMAIRLPHAYSEYFKYEFVPVFDMPRTRLYGEGDVPEPAPKASIWQWLTSRFKAKQQ